MAKSDGVQLPGVVFKKFLDDYQLSPAKFAEEIKLSQSSIRLLINNKLKISVPIALRLAKYFGNTAEFWIEIQNKYELAESAKDKELSDILKGIQKAKKPDPAKAKAPAGAKAPKKAAKAKAAKPKAARAPKKPAAPTA